MPIVSYNLKKTQNVRHIPTFLSQTLSIQNIKSNYASGNLLIILTFGNNHHFMHASKIMISYRYPTFAKKIVHRLTQSSCSKKSREKSENKSSQPLKSKKRKCSVAVWTLMLRTD